MTRAGSWSQVRHSLRWWRAPPKTHQISIATGTASTNSLSRRWHLVIRSRSQSVPWSGPLWALCFPSAPGRFPATSGSRSSQRYLYRAWCSDSEYSNGQLSSAWSWFAVRTIGWCSCSICYLQTLLCDPSFCSVNSSNYWGRRSLYYAIAMFGYHSRILMTLPARSVCRNWLARGSSGSSSSHSIQSSGDWTGCLASVLIDWWVWSAISAVSRGQSRRSWGRTSTWSTYSPRTYSIQNLCRRSALWRGPPFCRRSSHPKHSESSSFRAECFSYLFLTP